MNIALQKTRDLIPLHFDNQDIVHLNGGLKHTRVPMQKDTKRMLYWIVNRAFNTPLDLSGRNNLGVMGEILWSFFEPIGEMRNFKQLDNVERMPELLEIIIPKQYSISDVNVAKFNRIVYNSFIHQIVEIANVVAKVGKSRTKVIETLMKKADLYDVKSFEAIEKQCDRYNRMLSRTAYVIFE